MVFRLKYFLAISKIKQFFVPAFNFKISKTNLKGQNEQNRAYLKTAICVRI